MWTQILLILSTLVIVIISNGIYMFIQSWIWKRQNRKAVEKWDKELNEKIKHMHEAHDQWCDSFKLRSK
jgi:hypothetical protein